MSLFDGLFSSLALSQPTPPLKPRTTKLPAQSVGIFDDLFIKPTSVQSPVTSSVVSTPKIDGLNNFFPNNQIITKSSTPIGLPEKPLVFNNVEANDPVIQRQVLFRQQEDLNPPKKDFVSSLPNYYSSREKTDDENSIIRLGKSIQQRVVGGATLSSDEKQALQEASDITKSRITAMALSMGEGQANVGKKALADFEASLGRSVTPAEKIDFVNALQTSARAGKPILETSPQGVKFAPEQPLTGEVVTTPTKAQPSAEKQLFDGLFEKTPTSKPIETQPLIEQAKKYKSAEEFAFAKNTDAYEQVIKQRDEKIKYIQNKIDEINLLNTKDIGQKQGDAKIRQISKLKDQQIKIRLDTDAKEDFLINKITGGKSKLTDIWNQANQKTIAENPLTPEEQKIFEKEFSKHLEPIDRSFGGSLDSQYSDFYQLFKDPRINKSPTVKEAITNGDMETMRRELVVRGIMSKEGVDNMLYSQNENSDVVLEKFKDRLLKENPALMVGKEAAKVLEPPKNKGITSLVRNSEQPKQQKIDSLKSLVGQKSTGEQMPYNIYARHYLKKPSPSTLSLSTNKQQQLQQKTIQSQNLQPTKSILPYPTKNNAEILHKKPFQESKPLIKILLEKKLGFSQKNGSTYLNDLQTGSQVQDLISKSTLSQPQNGLSVKSKVNALDYVRTPFQVLKKLGLEKEGLLLKQKYDDYLRELPIEINKVTEWSKRANDKGASQRIFRYLDGQTNTLPSNELVVAEEIQSYLKQWADKLKLPEDNRVSHYITHLFEPDLIQKEFDPELAKLITDKVPGSVYDPFLQARLGKLGYKEDTWQALDAYIKRAVRKYNMDVALEPLKKAADSLDTESYKYIEELAARVNLRPTKWDTLFDNLIKSTPIRYKLGARPTAAITRTIRRMVYRGTLGLNIGSAVRNLTQGVNTFAELGTRYTMKGYVDLVRSIASKSDELERVGVLRDDFIQDRIFNATKKTVEKIDKGLFFLFEHAERINRGSAYFGAKAKALREGLSEEAAIKKAVQVVEKTQFHFGSVDTPLSLQSDIAKFFTQFQSFNVKQTEFLAGKFKSKDVAGIIRYIVGSILVVGTVGKFIGIDWKDMIPFSGVITGTTKLGQTPLVRTIGEIMRALFNAPDKYGNQVSSTKKALNVLDSLIPFFPTGSQIKKTYQGAKAIQQGGSFTKTGKLQFKQGESVPKQLQSLFFGKYASSEAQNYFNPPPKTADQQQVADFQYQKSQAVINFQPTFNKIQSLKDNGDITGAQKMLDELTPEDYNTYKRMKAARKAMETKTAEQAMYATVTKVHKLLDEGKREEAEKIVDEMSEEDYRIYGLAKKQMGYGVK